jgi:hypothetical protein
MARVRTPVSGWCLDGGASPGHNGVEEEQVDQAESNVIEAVNRLVDDYRTRCLWFLRLDYYPSTDEDRLRILGYLERYGDREAFQRAAAVRRWLSPTSNAPSAAS